jgi:glutamate-1-semialdehyde 2,1-aminomutase
LRLALLVHGVDIAGKPGGSVSAAHTDQDLAATADALREAVRMLRREADIKAA